MEWKDCTSYSQREESREPRSWSFQIEPSARIVITKGHIYCPGEWITHFYPVYENRQLNMPADQFTAEQAQEKALALAEGTLMALLNKLQSHLHESA